MNALALIDRAQEGGEVPVSVLTQSPVTMALLPRFAHLEFTNIIRYTKHFQFFSNRYNVNTTLASLLFQ